MYYKLNNFVFIRNINNYLQIIDKRDNSEVIGDYYSFLFAKHLDYSPLDIDTIVNKIYSEFSNNIDISTIKNDTIQFLDRLVDFGLVSSYKHFDEFSYLEPPHAKLENQKVLLPENELKKFQASKRDNPCLQGIIVEITQKCNERCVHCYIPHENKNLIMPDQDFYNIVDMCSKLRTVVDFRITGGECMSHPSFKKYIKYVKDKGFSLTLLTNLTMLEDETIDILKNGLLSQVQVSLFSLDPEVHDSITSVPGSLEKTMNNIEKLEKAGIPISIATQAMEINKNSIEGLYEYSKQHNFNLRSDWTIIAKEDRNNENLSYRINDLSKYKDICKVKLKYIDGYKNELKEELSKSPKPENSHLCNAGANGLYIDTNLNVHPCPGWDLSVGNLKRESLSDIWHKSAILQKVRDVVLKDFPKCAKCDIRNLCSICMAQADLENTTNNFKFEMPEYVCSMYRVIYDTIQEEVFDKKTKPKN